MLRSFVIISFVLVLLGSIYQLIVQYNYCEYHDTGNCYSEFLLEFIDFRSIVANNRNLVATLSALAIAMYAVLLIANILILRGLLSIKKDCESMFTHNTLLVSNMDSERLGELIQSETISSDQFDVV